MERQILRPIQWIILDDGVTKTEVKTDIPFDYHYNTQWQGRASLANKIAFAMDLPIAGEMIAFIEDDDWYSPEYLKTAFERMSQGHVLIGEGDALYYSVKYRWWYRHHNRGHASLCQTCAAASIKKVIKDECVIDTGPFLDVRLWSDRRILKKQVFIGTKTCIGIKSMPGRNGYGCGHKKWDRSSVLDEKLETLTQLIGAEDANNYAPFYENTNLPK